MSPYEPPSPFRRRLRLLCALLIGLCSLPALATGDAKTLRVVSDNNFPPYIFLNAQGQAEGYLVDLWQLWGNKTGISVELRALNWADAQKQLLAGQADVIDMIYRTEAREAQYDFSPPFAEMTASIYGHATLAGITGVDALRDFRVGVQAGDACIDQLKAAGIGQLVEFPNYRELIAASQQERVKVFCMDDYPADYYLYKLGLQLQFRRLFGLYQAQAHRAVRKGQADLLKTVALGMQAITPEEIRALEEKWFGHRLSRQEFGRQLLYGAAALLLGGAVLGLWNLVLRRRVQAKTRALQAALDELQRTHAAQVSAREGMAAVLHAIPDLLFRFDEQGHYLDVFTQHRQALFVPQEELIGRHVREVLPPEQAAIVLESIQQALLHGDDYGRTLVLDLGGRPAWFELSTTRVPALTGGGGSRC